MTWYEKIPPSDTKRVILTIIIHDWNILRKYTYKSRAGAPSRTSFYRTWYGLDVPGRIKISRRTVEINRTVTQIGIENERKKKKRTSLITSQQILCAERGCDATFNSKIFNTTPFRTKQSDAESMFRLIKNQRQMIRPCNSKSVCNYVTCVFGERSKILLLFFGLDVKWILIVMDFMKYYCLSLFIF